MIDSLSVATDVSAVRQVSPLVHNITNFVVMQQTANALLAIGASPVMAHSIDEVADMVRLAKALVLNTGTLDAHWIRSMEDAARVAEVYSIPIVLDPVGAGATPFRTHSVLRLLDAFSPSVIRGNAAEILAIGGASIQSKGVDSQYSADAAHDAGMMLCERCDCTVVISGAEDIVICQDKKIIIKNGVPMMTRVTGMGCTATALIGAFCAVQPNYFLAAAHAMAVMGISGEMAYDAAVGPGTFQVRFIDTLYRLAHTAIDEKLNVHST